ncbi:PAS domain-containing protein [Halosimplex rubrum]|uniref:histidine kinase n=1 Tax=Halosimplex rubrum TaxID=869889 RepID=A0A7D5P490_9EURY|nr:histidine kinase N-terminal 7TM domain-containing protein [Halosimplex rubrum]QLH77018.1 PAS domain-containing protein [Halosimplex rubrum]
MVSETVYVGVVALSTALAVAVAVWLWNEEMNLQGQLFVGIVGVYAVSGLLVIGELLAPWRSWMFAMFNFEAALTGFLPLLWFLLILEYTGYLRRIPRPAVYALVGWNVVVGVLEITNPTHDLIWSGYAVATSPFPHVQAEGTALAAVVLLPGSILYYAAVALLGAHLLVGPRVARKQTAALLVGYLPTFAIFTLWFGGAVPGPLTGALVIGSPLILGVVAWAVFRHQLFDLAPLARESVLEVLDDAVVVVDRDRRLLDYNAAAVETFGALPDHEGEPVERPLPELRPVDGPDGDRDGDPVTGDAPVVDRGDGTAAAVGEPDPRGDPTEVAPSNGTDDSPFVSTFTRFEDGEVREYDVTVSPLEVRGSVAGYTLVLRDVTERRQHVRDLEQQTTQLEQFAGRLSHDLRNPLNVAFGRVELARERHDDEHLATASDALERIEGIVDDTLTLAREGQTIDELERVDLATVARDAWETVDTGEAELVVEPDAGVRIYADATRLQSVFENCYRNCVEHGGASVTVTVERCDDGFVVADDGPGVPADEREQVFEYAYSSDDDGTGLGLAIVEAIARAHGWAVEMAESDSGGARVVFSGVETVETPIAGDGGRVVVGGADN